MGDFDEGAGGVGDFVACVFPAFAIAVSGAMGGDDDVWRGGGFGGEVTGPSALIGEAGFDGGIVSEFAEDGGGLLF